MEKMYMRAVRQYKKNIEIGKKNKNLLFETPPFHRIIEKKI